jgi:hypothetical protein
VGGAQAAEEFARLAGEAWDPDRPKHAIEGLSALEVLRGLGIEADFAHNGGQAAQMEWIHFTIPEGELYFVAHQTEEPVTVDCSFRVTGRQPELWNPMDGSRRTAVAFTQNDARTTLPIQFAPNGSTFVVFRKPIAETLEGKADSNFSVTGEGIELAGPWTVKFDPKWGGPESVVFETLSDWSQNDDPGIRFYSGITTYEKRFDASAAMATAGKGRIRLDLGNVLEMAEIWLNGRSLGIVWAPPFQIDVTDALKLGENVVEIRVANQWSNRVIGDLQLPPEQRRTKTNITALTAETPLLPSGLLGPVTLRPVTKMP